MGLVEEGVHVREQGISDVHCYFRGLSDAGPDIGFLTNSGQNVVIAVEAGPKMSAIQYCRQGFGRNKSSVEDNSREEGTELHPAVAKFFVGIAVESTGVHPEHRNAKERERA